VTVAVTKEPGPVKITSSMLDWANPLAPANELIVPPAEAAEPLMPTDAPAHPAADSGPPLTEVVAPAAQRGLLEELFANKSTVKVLADAVPVRIAIPKMAAAIDLIYRLQYRTEVKTGARTRRTSGRRVGGHG
jgi:hypothetical protein